MRVQFYCLQLVRQGLRICRVLVVHLVSWGGFVLDI